MTEKIKGEVEQITESQAAGLGGMLTEKISRRTFGKLLGAQTVLASTVSLSGCLGGGGGDGDSSPSTEVGLSRAAFVAKVSDYFGWYHQSGYNDYWKVPVRTFSDVKATDLYGKQIEGVIRSTFVIDVATDGTGTIEVAQYNVKATGHVARLRRELDLRAATRHRGRGRHRSGFGQLRERSQDTDTIDGHPLDDGADCQHRLGRVDSAVHARPDSFVGTAGEDRHLLLCAGRSVLCGHAAGGV